MPNLIFLGNYSSVDTKECNYLAEDAQSLVGISRASSDMEIVHASVRDGHDGIVNDDDYGTKDYVKYKIDGEKFSTKTDSTMTADVTLTLSDGTTKSVEVVVMQQANGDLFISDLLNEGTLDNLSIANVEITAITGDCFKGWYSDQSVDNTTLAPVVSTLDGTVEGTAGDDLIDVNYTGDPDGDRIDADDQILPGAGVNDDLVYGYGGDDTIHAGDGDDEVYGGSGDDLITGDAGDDVLYGDGGANGAGETVGRESFGWEGLSDSEIDHGITVDTGSVTVTYDRIQDTGSHNSSLSDVDLNVDGIDAGDQTVDSNSSLYSETGGECNQGAFSWNFSEPVDNVSFNINDIDGDGVVRVTAFDANGDPIEVILTGGDHLTLLDTDTVAGADTADSVGGYDDADTAGYNLNVSIPGPVSHIVVEHDQDGSHNSGINITEIFFDSTDGTPIDDLGDGNDTIFGGDGDDEIYGQGGDDTISGDAGDDVIFGGADRDVILGGAGDIVDGGAGGDDYDVLDVTGQGSFILTGPDGTGTPIPDSNGNGFDGRVVFVDANGDPTGDVIDFVEIEEIRGEQANAGPIAANDVFGAGEDDPAAVVGNVLGNDTDPEGDVLTVAQVNGDPAAVGTPVAGDNGGLVTIAPDGTVTFDPNGAFDALGEGEEATTQVTYTVTDPDGATSTATVTVTVTGTNDAPTAVADTGETDEDTVVVLDNVLGNDTDPDDTDLTVAQVNGSPSNVGAAVAGDNGGSFTIGADGTASFDPNGEFEALSPGDTAETSVTYTVTDPDGATSTTTVTVTVNGVNDGPVAVDNAYTTTSFETAGNIDGNVITDAGLNGVDSDPEGDTLTVSAVGGDAANVGAAVAGDNGGLFTINADGTVDFDANGDFDDLGLGATAETSVAYTIVDEHGAEDTATVTFAVSGINDGTVQGTAGNDIINPDIPYVDADGDMVDGNDAILPGDVGNDDLILGFGGDDSIDAGDGDDVVYGGAGNDTIDGGVGNDVLMGGAGNDTVSGGDGDDSIMGGMGDDSLAGNAGNDTVHGGVGDDTIRGGHGDDDLHGGAGDDTVFGGDDNDTVNGGAGNDTLDGGLGDDLVLGGQGDDSIQGGAGDDSIDGGTGNDNINAGIGSDSVEGGDGNDVINTGNHVNPAFDYDYPSLSFGDNDPFPDNDKDTVFGGAGDDVITTGDDADSIDGGAGHDYIDAGIDDDSVTGGTGNDTIIGGQGEDIIEGNEGDDLIYGGLVSDALDLPDAIDEAPDDNRDTIYGGAGNDTIYGRDDADTIYGGIGNDYLDGGIDDDEIWGDEGDDTILGGQGNDVINGGDGDDLIYGGIGDDTINGGAGRDTIYGGAGNDVIQGNQDDDAIYGDEGNDTITGSLDDDLVYGGTGDDEIRGGTGDDTLHGDAGNDYIQGGFGDDSIYGGDGDDSLNGGFGADIVEGGDGNDTIAGYDGEDTITGGAGEDALYGGLNSDTFYGGNGGDVVVGGEDPDDSDVDVLDLTGSNVDFITYTDGDPESGVVTFLDGSTMTFSEIENVIPCFTPGTTIATAKGERLVEELVEGDRIITRDNGIQEIAWVGHKEMTGKQLVQNPHLKPILIKAGALGNGLPERDMMVSPNHRVLVASDLTQLYFEENEVLAAAKHMVGAEGIHAVDVMSTTYVHFMFERHEVVLSNGAWTESFQPGDYSLKGIGNSQRNEIMELFPDLNTKAGLEGYQSARKALKKHEAKLLIK